MKKIYTRKRGCHECDMVAVKMRVAHQGGLPRDYQDRIDLDDLTIIIIRSGRMPPVAAESYLCFDNYFLVVDVVCVECTPRRWTGVASSCT
jgi:hypothetical protein